KSEGARTKVSFSAPSAGGESLRFSSESDPSLIKAVISKVFRTPPVISGQHLFDLHTTDGFPPDLTHQMAQERGLESDMEGYHKLMKEHEEKSRGQSVAQQVAISTSVPLPATDDRPKWFGPTCEGKVLGWIADNQFHTSGRLPETEVGLILDR